MPVYDKLVRDRIPEIIEKNGETPITHTADEREYRSRLKAKLLEEVEEFLADETIEELADIQEVITAICRFRRFDLAALQQLQADKKMHKGGFGERIVLERVD